MPRAERAADCSFATTARASNAARAEGFVADVALQGARAETGDVLSPRERCCDRLRLGDIVFRSLTRAAAIVVLVLLGGVILALIIGALAGAQTFGLGFLIDESWNPVTEKFGAHGADLRHDRHLAHRHADRRAGRAR